MRIRLPASLPVDTEVGVKSPVSLLSAMSMAAAAALIAVAAGLICPPALLAQSGGSFGAHAVLTYYHGGSSTESDVLPLADRAGNVLLCGTTRSRDFPQLPPDREYMLGSSSVFVAKHDREGATLLYSRRYGSELSLVDAAIGPGDVVILLVMSSDAHGLDSLLTPDAADSSGMRLGLLVLDCQGGIVYASYLPKPDLTFVDMEVAENGDLWLLFNSYNSNATTTPDALFTARRGRSDGYLLRLSAGDYRRSYATYIGSSDDDYYSDLSVGNNDVVLYGYTEGDDYPVAAATKDTLDGNQDLVLSVLDSSGTALRFSTYIGGKGSEYAGKSSASSDLMHVDSTGRMYFLFSVYSTDMAFTDTLRLIPPYYYQFVLGVMEPDGRISMLNDLGSTNGLTVTDMEVDGCGNVVLCGDLRYSSALHTVDPLMEEGRSWIAVLDTRARELAFSSYLRGSAASAGRMLLDGRLLYLAGSSDSSGLRPTPGLPGPVLPPSNPDAFLAAIDMPSLRALPAFSDSSMRHLTLEMLAPDTLLVDIPRQLVKPARFNMEARIRNRAGAPQTGPLQLRARVDGGISFSNGEGKDSLQLAGLASGGETNRAWTVLSDFDRVHPHDAVHLIASVRTEDPCPTGASAVKRVAVIYTDFTYADLQCDVTVEEEPRLTTDRATLDPDSARLHVTIVNRSDVWAPLRELRLSFPPNSGCAPLDPSAPTRGIPPIAPLDTVELDWSVRADVWEFDREVRAEVALVDTFGYARYRGAADIFIPGATGSRCRIFAPATVELKGDGHTAFDTVLVRLFVENESDTVRFYSALRLDLSAAPHLLPASGETLSRGEFYVRERFRRVFEWRLVAAPGIGGEVADTIRARYVSDADGGTNGCETVLRLLPQREELTCTWLAPDTLWPGGEPALIDTVTIAAVFTNTGNLPQDLAWAWLRPPDSVGVVEELRRPLRPLVAGASDTVRWTVLLPRMATRQEREFLVLALRPDDSEAARCGLRMFVAAGEGRYTYTCAVAGHDTLWRDPYYGRLIPDPLQLQYRLTNSGAVPMPECDVDIVLPSGLRPAQGESIRRRIPVLQPGEEWSAEWLLDVDESGVTGGVLSVGWSVWSGDSLLNLPCAQEIGIAERAPAGIVCTPWLLRFAGEYGEDAPDAVEVQLWTGGGAEPMWTAVPPSWLDVAPLSGRGHQRVAVGPSTTLLRPGIHTDSIAIDPVPLAPGPPRVIYVVDGIVGAAPPPVASAAQIRSLYPNPAAPGGALRAEVTAAPGTACRLAVHDLLGRERLHFVVDITASGRAMPLLPLAGLSPGAYVLVLHAPGVRVSRLFVLR